MTLASGARLGPYEVLAPLGAGGMGEVWRARDTRLARDVAVKVLPAEVAADPSRLKRFEKEARAASALNHPNIVTIYDIGSADSVAFIAMERVEGKTLRELLLAGGLSVKRMLPIAEQIAAGLAKAHEAGIVHRDLKPENVMVTKDGLVKILDFGLAKQAGTGVGSDEGSHLPTESGTNPGVVMGTAGYMSPEQASGERVDFRSDQFSLGAILYEMATGKRAFQKKTGVDTLAAILNEDPPPIASVAPQTPASLRWLIERCLAKDPKERYASTEDLSRDLAVLRDHVSEVSSPAAAATAGSRSRRGLQFAGLALGLAAVVLAAVFAVKSLASSAPLLKFHQLTFRREYIGCAKFAPDGQTIVYSADYNNGPMEVYTTRPGNLESRRLGVPGCILSLSSAGDMALGTSPGSVLAIAPLAGGAPRELVKRVQVADWSPDGKILAIARRVEGKFRVEYPIGTVVYESVNRIDNMHVSRDGERIAFREVIGQGIHVRGEVMILNTRTKEKRPTGIASTEIGWAPNGKDLWVLSELNELRAVRPGGGEKVLARFPVAFEMPDVAPDGRLLLDRLDIVREVRGLAPGAERERSLSWLDSSWAAALSDDVQVVLLDGPDHDRVYLRKTDGSDAVALGEGKALAISHGGDWALVLRQRPASQLVLYPTGAGETKVLRTPGFDSFVGVEFFPDGKRVLFYGTETGHKPRLYVVDVDGGTPRAIAPEGLELLEMPVKWISPDGRLVFVHDVTRGWMLYPLTEGEAAAPVPIKGFESNDAPIGWTGDPETLFVQGPEENPARVFRVNWKSGKRELFHEFRPIDPTQLTLSIVLVSLDGRAWVYSNLRRLGDLYVVEGLK